MGAKHIGLIGVDFTNDHFFGQTGQHPLANQLARINEEYRILGEALSKRGVEVVNLSKHSRITAFRKDRIGAIENMRKGTEKSEAIAQFRKGKIFFVHYKFLSCGDVFRHGLNHASTDLGIEFAEAYWDDPTLSDKVRAFNPDLIFVVHGRSFSKKWGNHFRNYNTAVWLLDEPYELDDTSKFSDGFTSVFVNDPNTIDRHRNAHYLPVGFDPHIYFPTSGRKNYEVGFVGGYNPVRKKFLETLNRKGLLSYVVGEPWQGKGLGKICFSNNIPAPETARLYKQTKIVLNIFRDTHHFNRQKIPAFSLNPRIYEALACGALVVSEYRPELEDTFPKLPVFENSAQLLQVVEELLEDNTKYEDLQKDCYQRLKEHTYFNRLRKVVDMCLKGNFRMLPPGKSNVRKEKTIDNIELTGKEMSIFEDWENYGNVVESNEYGCITLRKQRDNGPGTERGFVSKNGYTNIDLSFEVHIKSDSCFIAKVHQADKYDQITDSYHLMCNGNRSYIARHNHIFKTIDIKRDCWEEIRMVIENGMLSFYLNKHLLFSIKDRKLAEGYAFLGLKGGEVFLRNVVISNYIESEKQNTLKGRVSEIDYELLRDSQKLTTPLVSIITTVYDRVECLEQCIRSVKNQTFQKYEHIIVADSPSEDVIEQIMDVLEQEDAGHIEFANLKKRFNNWGIAPASVGILLSRGRYICFLSDDNGYTPDHIENLTKVLEEKPHLGFAYSSCWYDGRLTLKSPEPRLGQIDLGQPMFRRELFKLYFQDVLPFKEYSWDWRMIHYFMKEGIKWKYINKPTFIFKLAKYPHLLVNKQNKNPLVTISLLCHNSLQHTKKCIEGILAETNPEYELLITDNGSTDNTYEYLQSINDTRIKVIRNPKNIGFIEAHNEALKSARGCYFLVLNNDLIFNDNWLDKIIGGFDDPDIKIVGPVAGRLDGQGKGYETVNGEIEYIEGCCLAIKTDFAKAIGLFRDAFEFMYCEDSDLCLRTRAMGYKIKKVDCGVSHLRGMTASDNHEMDIRGYWLKNHYILKKRWKKYLEAKSFKETYFLKRTRAIGDVFLLSPIIEHLKRENVHRRINVVTQAPQLLEGNPLIERIWSVPPREVEVFDLDGAYERRPMMHIIDAYAQELDIRKSIIRQPKFYLNTDDIIWASEHCQGEYIVFHVGQTSWPGRNIPITTMKQVVEILKKRGLKTVEIGNSKNLPNVDEDFIGCSWKQTAGIIRNSIAFIGIDSAPMHIAQAFMKPGAVVFGCVNPEYRLVNPEILRPVVANVGCQYCHHWRSAPRDFSDCLRNDPLCMNMIKPDQIIEQLDIALKMYRNGRSE
jgi:GT2 family glycosyltransferase/spore maturation protein CgeB